MPDTNCAARVQSNLIEYTGFGDADVLREIAVEGDTNMARQRGEHEEGSGGVKIGEPTSSDLPPLIRTNPFSGMCCGSFVENCASDMSTRDHCCHGATFQA